MWIKYVKYFVVVGYDFFCGIFKCDCWNVNLYMYMYKIFIILFMNIWWFWDFIGNMKIFVV